MIRVALFGYLCFPALLALGTLALALRHEPFGTQMFMAYVVAGFLFYAAPHLLWTVVAALGKFSRAVWHAGLVAASITLAVIAALSLVEPDPSGLPMQWLLYWPLALVLQVVLAGAIALYRRRRPHAG